MDIEKKTNDEVKNSIDEALRREICFRASAANMLAETTIDNISFSSFYTNEMSMQMHGDVKRCAQLVGAETVTEKMNIEDRSYKKTYFLYNGIKFFSIESEVTA